MTIIRVIRVPSGKEVAAVMDWDAVEAVSRLQGKVWLIAAAPGSSTKWYFDGARAPLEDEWVARR